MDILKDSVRYMGFESETELVPFTPAEEQELRDIAIKRAPKELADAETAETEEKLFYALPRAAMAAWHLQKIDLARTFAEKAITLAPGFSDNWNFGNAIHFGHSVLGLIELRNGQVDKAVLELHKAGDVPGSPQLNSFGPSMQLAKALARHGEFKAVLDYIEQCRVFWQTGNVWLDLWEKKLLAGEVPNFFWGCNR